MSDYCPICGNTGIRIDGTPCSCRVSHAVLYQNTECLTIPEQYRGVKFTPELLPPKMGTIYQLFMRNLYDGFTTERIRFKNMLLCSPVATGKTTLAYTVLQQMFLKGYDVFTLYDVLEIKRMLWNNDMGRKQTADTESVDSLYTSPYLFVRIPSILGYEVFDSIAFIIDRRVRKGNSTIFIYNGSWDNLVRADGARVLSQMKGDGTYCTLEVHSMYPEKE